MKGSGQLQLLKVATMEAVLEQLYRLSKFAGITRFWQTQVRSH